jgi:hypothetical protein
MGYDNVEASWLGDNRHIGFSREDRRPVVGPPFAERLRACESMFLVYGESGDNRWRQTGSLLSESGERG